MMDDTKIVIFSDKAPVELVEVYAEQFAVDLARNASQKDKATKTQLRRFYQEYAQLRDRIQGEDEYEKYAPAVKMLISKAAYSWRGGKESKIPELFYYWITRNVKAIKSAEDVQKFGDYFEAVIGYFYAQGDPARNGGRQ